MTAVWLTLAPFTLMKAAITINLPDHYHHLLQRAANPR
jgi:hypothetical protein